MIEALLQKLAQLPILFIYAFIGAGAAVENFIPPIPADTFVLLGAFLAAGGRGSPFVVFLVTWGCNVIAAAVVYFLADEYGERFFEHRFGQLLLNRKQLEHIEKFYERWGVPAIFVSRFLPTLRAMVPVFAGVTHVPFLRVFLPLAFASALWYGFVVYVGAAAGRNWQAVSAFFERFSTVLLAIAVVVLSALAVWWWKSRKHKHK